MEENASFGLDKIEDRGHYPNLVTLVNLDIFCY